jgi:nucleoid-associated protein YgaU
VPLDSTVFEKDQPIKTTKFHIVRQGESLSMIAQQYYGSPNNWRKILTANEKAIKDANKIVPGTKLIIPE